MDDVSERNRRVVLDMYEAGIGGNLPGMLEHVAGDDFVLHEPSYLPYGGIYRTTDGMVGAFTKFSEYLDVASIEIDHAVADGEHALVVLQATDRVGVHHAYGSGLHCLDLPVPGGESVSFIGNR